MKYDFITIGGATEDIVFYTDEGYLLKNTKDSLSKKLLAFRYGSKVKVDKSHSFFGGGSVNAVVNFARLGFRTNCIVAVGNGYRGKEIIKNLKKQGVNTSLVQKVKGLNSSFSVFAIDKNGEYVAFVDRGAKAKLSIGSKELKEIKKSKWVYLTSLAGEWEKSLSKIFKQKDYKVAWNPGKTQLEGGTKKLGKFLKKTDVLLVNKSEAMKLVMSNDKYKKKNSRFLDNIKNLSIAINGFGVKIVIVTNNRDGAYFYDGANFYHQKIIGKKAPKDTTGVGDCFNSTFVAGLEYFNDYKKAMYLGVKNAEAVTLKQGAQNGLLMKKDLFK